MVAFEVPQVAANDSGWGPTDVPEQLDGVPYAPFGKGDRVGRVSDFTAAGQRYGGACTQMMCMRCGTAVPCMHLCRVAGH